MRTSTRCPQDKWRTLLAGGIKVFLTLFLLSFLTPTTNAQTTPTSGPCFAHRWFAGDGWRFNTSTQKWEAVTLASPNLQPKGIVRCASSAETESGLTAFKQPYRSSLNGGFTISQSDFNHCFDQQTETRTASVNAPSDGEDIVWFNFDIRPLAGTYQFQIVTNQTVGWALYYVDPTFAQPTSVTGSSYPPTVDGLSGDCSKLIYADCGTSGTGWSTITVPSFTKPTNYYLAMWLNETGTGDGKSTFPNSMNLTYKSRYGCGGSTCSIAYINTDLTCTTNGYQACSWFGGSAGQWTITDNSPTPASSYTVTYYQGNTDGSVGAQIGTSVTSPNPTITLGTIPDGAVFARICAEYPAGQTNSLTLNPVTAYVPPGSSGYVPCTSTATTGVVAAPVKPTLTATATPNQIDIRTSSHSTQLGVTLSSGNVSDYTYAWTEDGAGTLNNAAIATPVYTAKPLDQGQTITFNVTATPISGNNCTITGQVTVDVNVVAPCAVNCTDNCTPCQGTTSTFTGPVLGSFTTFKWTVASGDATISGADNGQTVQVVAGANNYSVQLEMTFDNPDLNSTCSSAVVTVTPRPVCNITGNNVICAGQTASFTATGGTSYSWTGPGGFTATGATISDLTVAGTYTVTVSNGPNCTSTCSRILTVNPLPICDITGNNVICAGQTASFTATGGTSYSWTGPGGFTASTATISGLTTAGTYTVTVTNANNCSSTCSRTLTVNPLPVCDITGNNVICAGQTASFTATGGTSYSWTGPGGFTASTATISGLTAAGTYTVTVTNANNCSSTCSRTLTVNPLPECSITGNNIICSGGSTSFTATAGMTTYAWTGPGGFTASTQSTGTITAAGTYTVTITNANGCSSTCSRVLTVNQTPTCEITGNNVICAGQTASFTAAGGTTFAWTGPGGFTASTATISGLTTAGTYTVTVSSGQNCTSTCSRTLTVNPLPVCDITGNNVICAGQTASFTATGGTSYSWTGPGGFTASTATISGLTAAGTYTVTVTNANNCSSTCSRTLTVNPLPECSITGNNIICSGGSTSFTATAGMTTYAWTGPGGFTASTQSTGTITAAGTYTVTITNANGCSSTCSRVLTVNQTPTCEITGNNVICAGQTASFTAAGGTTFAWTGPGGFTASTATISGLTTAGTYTVTVSSGQNCTSTCSRTLTVNPLPECSITGNNVICAGQTASFTATGGTSYSWTGPGGFTASTATISGLTAAGTYTVTVTNANNCSSTCSRTLTVNPLPECSITGNNIICSGGSTSFTATAGMTTYAWTGPGGFTASTQSTGTITAAGTYTVTITNANGCTSTCSRVLTVNQTPTCEITGNNVICAGQTASFTAAGGTTFAWTGPGGFTATTATISGLTTAGTYTVTVSSGQNCTSTCSRTLTVNPLPECNITGNNVICAGQTASFTATGGTSYSWTGPGGFTATGATISGLTTAGTYTVTVTNANNCSSTCSRTLTVNPLPECSITGNNIICSGGSTSFSATAGMTTYAWTGPGGFTASTQSTGTITVAGTYTVTITNANGCTSTCSRVLTVNQTPTCEITGNNVICAGQTASFTAAGGTTFAWTGPGGFTATTATISGLTTAGTYTVTVSSGQNCTSTCSRTLTVNPLPECNITGNNVICAGQTASFTATGGTSYSWTGPGGFTATGATISGLTTAGTYTVTVTNANNCSSTCSRTLTVNPLPECSITGNNIICSGGSTSFSATAGMTTYAWTGPGGFTASTQSTGTITAAGTYTVTITNANGCTSTCSRVLTVNSTGAVTATSMPTTCGLQNGSITITAPLGADITYTVNGVTQSGTTFSNLPSGFYSIVAHSTAGCTSSGSATVGTSTNLGAVTATSMPTTCGLQNGSITITAPLGTGITYTVNGVTQSGTTFSNLPSGFYSIVAHSTAGCTSSGSATVGTSTNLGAVTATSMPTTCGLQNGSITITAPLGTGITYTVNGVTQSGTTFSNLPSGFYSIVAHSTAGCTSSGSATVGTSTNLGAVTATSMPTTCGLQNGSITITAPLGTGITYTVNGVTQSGTTFSNLPSGFYSIVAHSTAGCTSSGSATVGTSTNLGAVTATSMPTTCGLQNGSITITAPLGTGITYTVNGVTQSGTTFSNLPSGFYSIVAHSTAGCTSSGSATVGSSTNLGAVTATSMPTTCGLQNGSITITAPLGAGITYTVNGVTQSGTTFSNLPSGFYSIVAHSTAGCTSSGSATVGGSQPCLTYCSYTQGFWGNKNGLKLLPGLLTTPIMIGRAGHSFTIPAGSATMVNNAMPGGTTPRMLLAGDCIMSIAPSGCFMTSYATKQGRINNVLLSQTITLTLNTRLAGNPLLTLPIQSGCLVTGMGSFTMNQSVVNYLTYNGASATVADLLTLANDLLGGTKTPGANVGTPSKPRIVPSYSDVNDVVDAMNNAFDGCTSFKGYQTCVTSSLVVLARVAPQASTISDHVKVSAYPNPYTDKVRFTIKSSVSGQGSLDVFNMVGQKVKTVYQGYVHANTEQVVEYRVPDVSRQNLIFVMTVNGERVTGKLLNAKE